MLYKFSAWSHLSNFDQSECKNWLWPTLDHGEKSQKQLSSLLVIAGWIFTSEVRFKIHILIVWHVNTTYFIWIWKKIKLDPAIIWSNLSANNFKKYSASMGQHLSPRYSQVILISRYPDLTAVNWSQHWCAICVQYQFSCTPKLARKCEIEHWLPCGADGRVVYSHVITKFSGMGRFT